MIGQYDAAVIDKEDGKPHVLKRMDRPHIRVIPEWFGGGTLPRKGSTRRLSSSPPTRQGSCSPVGHFIPEIAVRGGVVWEVEAC
jgi:hypothetical protein